MIYPLKMVIFNSYATFSPEGTPPQHQHPPTPSVTEAMWFRPTRLPNGRRQRRAPSPGATAAARRVGRGDADAGDARRRVGRGLAKRTAT